ncbi:helix-turn-helix domain-containing protein [Mycolicibacterium arenosum]|uniref:Helix-turn-helix domain-containing protein n=1 Tax=Mycolicibacterium arenosum TaxID=2952157 RepID=A0ABT1MBD5_9MYCO|nr:helix-turn-helix transcriptional regulator [Mycolicibacterium sp. CAU 1645]MCP9276489.1 helix-turn-helix domain-containing protein [Mycolicibacterium sp. CAU 1645]
MATRQRRDADIGTGDPHGVGSPAEGSPASTGEIDPTEARPDVARLARYMNGRLRELGMSQLEASKLGFVSRSTLNLIGKDDRVPGRNTLEKLDDLLGWERGSSYSVIYGSAPVAREANTGAQHPPVVDVGAEDDYENLGRWIERRLRQLNMSKARFAEVGGPSRTTIATLGQPGHRPTSETLDRIDTHLMWEPGSALAALKGGVPINRGPAVAPHPALVPLSAIRDRLKVMRARAQRQRAALDQFEADIDDAMRYVDLVVGDLSDLRRRMTSSTESFGPDPDDGAEPADGDDASS